MPEVQVTDRRVADVPGSPPAARPPAAEVTPEVTLSADRDPPQDEATYRCGCGYVFAAAVSTSVACPYCGDAQAW
jgi:hypothetical protein